MLETRVRGFGENTGGGAGVSFSIPLIVGSGGTGRTTAGSATMLVGINSDGLVYDFYNLMASDNATIVRSGTAYFISANTGVAGSSVVYSATGNSYVLISNATDLTADRALSASTGLTLTDGGANGSVSLSVNMNLRKSAIGFFGAGNCSTSMLMENMRVYIPFNVTLSGVWITAQTAPTGAALIINLDQWNSSLGASTSMFLAGSRPTIADGAFVGSNLLPSTVTIFAGSYLGISVDQVGSTISGSNLTVNVITMTS